jgi:aerobic C4-dicarboxylate transport protein
MSQARSLTNFVGNGVATIVISNWERELDHAQLRKELAVGYRPVETTEGGVPLTNLK